MKPSTTVRSCVLVLLLGSACEQSEDVLTIRDNPCIEDAEARELASKLSPAAAEITGNGAGCVLP